ETHAATQDSIVYEPAPPVLAKGKTAPVKAWIAIRAALAAGERRLSVVPLVGRGRELETLRWIWQRTTEERQPHLVTVVGEAGVGKTRVAVEFSLIAGELGARTIHD